MKFAEICRRLKNGFFLSSMMKITDGLFCSERSEGCAMVQLGAYLAEPPLYGKARYFLPADPEECTEFLAEECGKAKGQSDVCTCLNLAAPRLEWGLAAAECFCEAGGDFVELNVHGSYEPYFRLGKVRAMVLPENRDELFRWVEAFSRLEVPLIVKFRMGFIDDYSPVLERLADFNVFAVHFNVRNDTSKKPDIQFVKKVRKQCKFSLLASGYVRSEVDAKMLFKAGADMVGMAEPTIKDPKYIAKIAKSFKAKCRQQKV